LERCFVWTGVYDLQTHPRAVSRPELAQPADAVYAPPVSGHQHRSSRGPGDGSRRLFVRSKLLCRARLLALCAGCARKLFVFCRPAACQHPGVSMEGVLGPTNPVECICDGFDCQPRERRCLTV
ncbi:hypothetical protein HDU91_004669, partial [Kappamyces sp. JEL0680]